MCGLVAIINSSKQNKVELTTNVDLSLDRIRHRGPDGRDVWLGNNGRIAFGHVRLSILDLDNGSQPMSIEDGTTIVFNGEIYNFIELQKELGINNFKTSSDTEVILRAYKKWGENCVNHLRGMFSFVIWDELKEANCSSLSNAII